TFQKVIVLMSDGDSLEGYPCVKSSEEAKKQNVFIYTIGIGSNQETYIQYQNQLLPVTFNEKTLKQIAVLSEGAYFRAFSEKDFKTIYERVKHQTIEYQETPQSLSPWVALGTLLLILMGVLGHLGFGWAWWKIFLEKTLFQKALLRKQKPNSTTASP
ncbi:MAG: VWA domain-containing protein, partial [Cyanobacteria bacterium]|nr:VWA domain-containing protein [Cyanobacteriota bacterium]